MLVNFKRALSHFFKNQEIHVFIYIQLVSALKIPQLCFQKQGNASKILSFNGISVKGKPYLLFCGFYGNGL